MLNNPAEKAITLDQSVQTFDQIDKGFIPGFGAAQIDTFPEEDNVDPGHPLNVDYYLANNFQRLLGARLSFKLRAYRTYATLTTTIGQSFVTSPLTNADLARSALMVQSLFLQTVPKITSIGGHQHPAGSGLDATTTNNITAGNIITDLSSIQTLDSNAANASTAPMPALAQPAATALTSASNSLGVVEDLVATGIRVTIDGTDVTSLLTPAGPYTADQVEIDLRPVMTAARITPSAFHTIALSSTQRGRIHAFLRLTYFVNGQIA
jgi:hypothetical protein